jgi:PleD family two-component response regulator
MLVTGETSHFMIKFPKKILLIDREPGVTRLVRRALDRAGKYVIREEHDDRLALHAARWFQPDLILLDTAGPDRQNLEKEIQSDAALRETPVLSLNSLKPESEMVSDGILSGSPRPSGSKKFSTGSTSFSSAKIDLLAFQRL